MEHTLELYPQQLEAATLLSQERGGVAWHRVGEGKTRIAIAAFILYIPAEDVTSQFCVFCRPESFYDWVEEARKMGVPPERLVLKSFGQLSTKSADAIIADVIRNPRIAMVCFDELYLYKNYKSKRAEAANKISSYKPAVGLSGSIMTAKNLEDVYGQAFSINKHRRIAPTMTKFREGYMMGFNDLGFTKWSPQRGAYARLMQACSSFAHVHMPLKSARTITESYIKVDVTSQQEAIFDELRDTMQVLDLDIQLDNALALMVKLQQVSNGWIKGPDGTVHEVASNKVKRVIAWCEELLAAGKRAVIWCAFRHDVEILRCAAIGKFNTWTMVGGEPFDIASWNDKKVDPGIVFATEASGSSVNHFAQVEYAGYFSMSQRWLDFQQSRGRTDRKSSEHDECFYAYFQTAGSIDESILRRVRQAGSAEGAMLNIARDLQRWLKREDRG